MGTKGTHERPGKKRVWINDQDFARLLAVKGSIESETGEVATLAQAVTRVLDMAEEPTDA